MTTEISASIICDSINPQNCRLTTWILKYPRFIHSEVMTHRVASRNAASSRAQPLKKVLSVVKEAPAVPYHWGKNQSGMQAKEEVDAETKAKALTTWLEARDAAIKYATVLGELGVHKQIANRLLEPFMTMTILFSATEHDNYFGLRDHADAQPEFQALAHIMLEEYNHSTPKSLNPGEWHIPFGGHMDPNISDENRLKIATARAARLSYLTFDGLIDREKDYALHDSLKESGHFSPFEHSAMCVDTTDFIGNFRGFRQYRKNFVNESRVDPRIERKQWTQPSK